MVVNMYVTFLYDLHYIEILWFLYKFDCHVKFLIISSILLLKQIILNAYHLPKLVTTNQSPNRVNDNLPSSMIDRKKEYSQSRAFNVYIVNSNIGNASVLPNMKENEFVYISNQA